MKIKTLLFLILISLGPFKVLAATDCTQVTEIPQIECEALIALYDSTDGSNWENRTGWNITNTPCSWYGITCNSGHVVKLDLHSNRLIGLIPAELGKLSSLQVLDLNYNQLSDSIPVELGKLSNLQELHLYNNQLSGTIPVELGNLGNLEGLYLDFNLLSGSIPAELGNLSNLKVLYLNSNQLSSSIPAELGNLSNLLGLYLNSNQLCGSIPAELGNLSNLLGLFLNSNQLCGNIPLSLMDPNNLRYLFLQNNGLNVTDLDPQLEVFFNGLFRAILEPQDPSICPTSLATLAFFKAIAVAGLRSVLLEWQTLSEHENAGFYILRGEPIGPECTSNRSDYYEVVEVGFKSTEGDGFSVAPYSYWDDTVKPRTTYCYLLEDRDFGGNSTFHWDSIVSVTTD